MCEASLIIQVVVVRNRFIINAANNSNEDIKYSFNDPFRMKNVIDINHLDFNKQPKFLKLCRTACLREHSNKIANYFSSLAIISILKNNLFIHRMDPKASVIKC